MNGYVATIPMNPAHADQLGFLSLFAYAKMLALSEDVKVLYGVNTHGKIDTSHRVALLKTNLDTLRLSPDAWWHDVTLQQNHVSDTLHVLRKAGILVEDERTVRQCACGKVEVLADIVLHGGRKSLLKNGIASCCNTNVVNTVKPVLLTAKLPSVRTPLVFPSWAFNELSDVMQRLGGSQLLISRSTPRPFSIMLRGREFPIDTDALWLLYLHWLQEECVQVSHLVVGASTVRQAGVLSIFSSLLGIALPSKIHVLPKVFFSPLHGVTTLRQVVDKFGSTRTTNALLWSALSERKEFTLNGALFPSMVDTVPTGHVHQVRRFLKKM